MSATTVPCLHPAADAKHPASSTVTVERSEDGHEAASVKRSRPRQTARAAPRKGRTGERKVDRSGRQTREQVNT
jgi:hypothetical protein